MAGCVRAAAAGGICEAVTPCARQQLSLCVEAGLYGPVGHCLCANSNKEERVSPGVVPRQPCGRALCRGLTSRSELPPHGSDRCSSEVRLTLGGPKGS